MGWAAVKEKGRKRSICEITRFTGNGFAAKLNQNQQGEKRESTLDLPGKMSGFTKRLHKF